MRILGIDPGLRTTGFGVIEQHGTTLSYIASGTIKTVQAGLPQRLATLFESISTLIHDYAPQQSAIEKVFVNINPQSTLLLGQARGAAICALMAQQVPVAEYTALQLKQAVAGYGRATKAQIQEMVARLLALSEKPGTDAADALGIAICHAHAGAAVNRLATLAPALAKKGLRVRRGRLVG